MAIPRKTLEQFVDDARRVHGSKYDYSAATYTNAHTKMSIKCNKCGSLFAQNPSNHLSGKGCAKCGVDSIRLTTKEFVQKAIAVHGLKYDYSNSV